MEWLNTYAFPRETAHSDSHEAIQEYKKLCSRLVAHGTTTALIFGTIYKEACQRLALSLQSHGLRGFIGKVCMDRSAILVHVVTIAPLHGVDKDILKETAVSCSELGRITLRIPRIILPAAGKPYIGGHKILRPFHTLTTSGADIALEPPGV